MSARGGDGMAVVRLAGMIESELSVFLKIAEGGVDLDKYGFHVHERSCSKIVNRESYAPGSVRSREMKWAPFLLHRLPRRHVFELNALQSHRIVGRALEGR